MAQVSRAAFASSLATLINTNGAGEVTAADVRSILTDLEDSAVWFDEVGTAAASATGDFAAASHNHTVSDVTDLDTGDNLLLTAAERTRIADAVVSSEGTTVSSDVEDILTAADVAAVLSVLGLDAEVDLTQVAYDALTPDEDTTYYVAS